GSQWRRAERVREFAQRDMKGQQRAHKLGDFLADRRTRLAIAKVVRAEIDAVRGNQGSEPCKNSAKLRIGAEVMVLRCSHRNNAAGLAGQARERSQVQEVLEGAREGCPINRSRKRHDVRRSDALDDRWRIVIELIERASIGKT